MKLADYLKGNSQAELARRVGVSDAFLSMVASGVRRPSPDTAKLIEEATEGKVSRMELLYPNEVA